MHSRINSVDSINYILTPVLKECGNHCLYLHVLKKKRKCGQQFSYLTTMLLLLKEQACVSK